MLLLVSVASADEAATAVAGGADIIDAKDPAAGPLGAVRLDVLSQIVSTAGAARLVTAALGDAADHAAIERAAFGAASAGAGFVKIGFAGVAGKAQAASLLAAAGHGAASGGDGRCGVVAVAYADADAVASLNPDELLDAAAAAGSAGVLLDTAHKNGPGLRGLIGDEAVSAWVARAHRHGLMVALAGRLQLDDLDFVREAGADIAGVRGAACDGGRAGRISVEKVRALARLALRHRTSPREIARR